MASSGPRAPKGPSAQGRVCDKSEVSSRKLDIAPLMAWITTDHELLAMAGSTAPNQRFGVCVTIPILSAVR